MKLVVIIVTLLLLFGCSSTAENVSTASETNKSYCERLANAASSTALLKWAGRQAEPEDTEGWRIIAFVNNDSLSELGLSQPEIMLFVKEIYENDFIPQLEHDTLSYGYYYKAKCDIESEGHEALPLSMALKPVSACWNSENDVTTEQCVHSVIKRESAI